MREKLRKWSKFEFGRYYFSKKRFYLQKYRFKKIRPLPKCRAHTNTCCAADLGRARYNKYLRYTDYRHEPQFSGLLPDSYGQKSGPARRRVDFHARPDGSPPYHPPIGDSASIVECNLLKTWFCRTGIFPWNAVCSEARPGAG